MRQLSDIRLGLSIPSDYQVYRVRLKSNRQRADRASGGPSDSARNNYAGVTDLATYSGGFISFRSNDYSAFSL
jgi:hypothetical protein